jgi:hypothetical protein
MSLLESLSGLEKGHFFIIIVGEFLPVKPTPEGHPISVMHTPYTVKFYSKALHFVLLITGLIRSV